MWYKARFSADEVAYYLTKRLVGRGQEVRGRKAASKKGNGWLKKELAAAVGETASLSIGLDVFAKERVVSEIAGLAREKEDLIRQIRADSRFVSGTDGAILKSKDKGNGTALSQRRSHGADDDGTRSLSHEDVLYQLDAADALEEVHLPALIGQFDIDGSQEWTIQEARNELARVSGRITELLSDPAAAYAYQEEIKSRVQVMRLARNADTLDHLLEKSRLAMMQLAARRNSEDLPLTSADLKTLGKHEIIVDKARAMKDHLMNREDVFYEKKRRGLLEYRRQLMTGGFVKTESVKNEIVRVLSHLQMGIPVFLRGHLGVGKTELALHVCRHYLGVEPEFISGSEEATKYDIYGRTQIGVASEAERLAELRRQVDHYRRTNPDASDAEIRDVEKGYYEAIVVKGQTSSFFQEGPLVRAIKEGKPLIIDEMDGIPHSIIMRMNHVLTRRPGDKGRVQESGGEEIVVQKGFCVIATGNVKSSRYKREELDAAFLSRWWSEDIRYPPQNETYEILTAALIDRRGDLQVKNSGDLDDLKRLTEVASEIQQIFMGERLDYLGEGADAARGVAAGLKKSVLSLRHLWNIVRPWKANNFVKPLEYYILEEFIRPAVAEDQVYLVQLFCRFRFFKDWTIDRFELPGLTEAKLAAFQGRVIAQV